MRGNYEALATKVRAMYGKRLRNADFARMASMRSVDEVYADLRQHPVWGGAVASLTGIDRFSRARLEHALREQYRSEYARLSAFIPQGDRAFLNFPVLGAELDGILYALSRLRTGREHGREPAPSSLIRYAKTDEKALARCGSFAELLEAARGSLYYPALVRLCPVSGLPDFTRAETVLRSVYYQHLLELAKKRYEGEVRALLQRSVGTQVDLLNLMHILRLKRYFPDCGEYAAILLPFYYKLKPAQVAELCQARDVDAALELIARTPYARIFQNTPVEEVERLYSETLFRLSRRQLMMGRPSVYSAVAFLNLRELELKALIRVVETVKYQADYDSRLAELLGK